MNYWIKETHPEPDGIDLSEDSPISIIFNQDIDRLTLNMRNILILDGNNGGRLISNRFLHHYDVEKKTLFIYMKENAERLGSGNKIEIILTGRIANFHKQMMGIPYHLQFITR